MICSDCASVVSCRVLTQMLSTACAFTLRLRGDVVVGRKLSAPPLKWRRRLKRGARRAVLVMLVL